MDGAGELSEGAARPEGMDDAAYIRALERENEALRAANAKLARETLGSSNAAAAGRLALDGRGGEGRSLGRRLLAPLRSLRLLLRRIVLRTLR